MFKKNQSDFCVENINYEEILTIFLRQNIVEVTETVNTFVRSDSCVLKYWIDR